MNPWRGEVEFGMPTRFEKGRRAIIPAHIRQEQARRRRGPQPSVAACHETAHEYIAKARGYRNVRAFVRDRDSGMTYMETAPSFVRTSGDKRFFNCRATIRARAAVALAGGIAEAMLEGRAVPDVDTLLDAEWPDESENPLLPLLAVAAKHECDGDSDRAARLVGELLEEARMETIIDLRRAWPQIVKRARELDRKAAA